LEIPVLETGIEEFRQAIDDLEKSNDDKTRRITELEAAVNQMKEKIDFSSNQIQNTDNSIIQLEDSSDKQRRKKKDEVNKNFI
jgi:uncharacterized coiled-coil DUF342 family protein